MTTPGLRERKKVQTRQRIIQAAMALFLERGFDDVSITEIADAADVSKMTVFNYFPAKEDMFFAGPRTVLPDVAGAIRARPASQSVMQAVRSYTRAALENRAEWTGLHDGVAPFARMMLASPTLTAASERRWNGLRQDLVAALAEVTDAPPVPWPGFELSAHALASVPDNGTPVDPEAMRPFLLAEQIIALLRSLTTVNLLGQVAGVAADRAAESAFAVMEIGFDQLEHGVRTYGTAP